MKIKRLVGLLAELTPHAYSDSIVLMWLSQCENSILADIFLVAPPETKEYEEVTEQALLVPHPYDKLYLPYLQAQVAHANQEYDIYANLMALYNAYRYEYAQYIVNGADPGSGDAVAHGYYLSAYGIAIAHGYAGTEEEWIRSLKGATGEAGQSAYELAVEQGFDGSEEEWIASLHGADGVGRTDVMAETANGVTYAAEVRNFEPKLGLEIVLVPQSANASAPTLSINGGEAYPLCLRPGWNVNGNDRNPQLTMPVPAGTLLRGAEYVFRFDGQSWILQSYVQPAPEYVDVTESYRRSDDYRDHPQEYLRSLGAGKWTLDDEWAVYSTHCWEVSGTVWLDESYTTDDGFFRRTLTANGQEKVYLDSGDGVLRINGKPLSGAAELDWAAMDAVIGDAISEGGGGSPEGGGGTVGGVTEARMQAYVTEQLKGYVTEEAMKAYVKEYVDSILASIPIAEEGAY